MFTSNLFLNLLLGRSRVDRTKNAFLNIEYYGRLSAGYARAAATASARLIYPQNPTSWEFSGFSQHGEDGIIDLLHSKLKVPRRFFLEIGSGDSLENNSAWLAFARHFGGVMVEGDPDLSARYRKPLTRLNPSLNIVCQRVDNESLSRVLKLCPYTDFDLLSVDIDSIDFYIVQRILDAGYRPAICVVEYNSAFGPEIATTIPYDSGFDRWKAHASGLYYGVSVRAWRLLFESYGYVFLTVESSGTNAFFVDPVRFDSEFIANVNGTSFLNNTGDLNGATRPRADAEGDWVLPARDWRTQFKLIEQMEFVSVENAVSQRKTGRPH